MDKRSQREMLSTDEFTEEGVQKRCIKSVANIVRIFTGRIVIPDQLHDAVLSIATLMNQRCLTCSEIDAGSDKRSFRVT